MLDGGISVYVEYPQTGVICNLVPGTKNQYLLTNSNY